ncbi:MAG: nucleotidyltransferase family protein [Bacteroidetes bacterium]|nr:nucleotidyltransferase family protein [Bacteroidota bacterium]
MKAMIFSAGLGSRLKPFTDNHPKALALVNGKTLLERNILYLQKFGITEVIVNVHHFADQIIEAIEKNNGWGSTITISDEREEVLETGGGLKKAAWYFEGRKAFVVMNVDILTDFDLMEMIRSHEQEKPLATLAVTQRRSSRYFLFDTYDALCGWRNIQTEEEKPADLKNTHEDYELLKEKAFSGIHVISPHIFSLIKQEGKFSMVDVYLDLMKKNKINSFDHTGGTLLDVGKPESILTAEELFG